jgi:signal transduction histidine kinase
MGIPENQLGKIFSLFKRYHTKIEGSGIGLYIVKRIIENNGGRVEVKSEVNKGTTFNLIFTYKS